MLNGPAKYLLHIQVGMARHAPTCCNYFNLLMIYVYALFHYISQILRTYYGSILQKFYIFLTSNIQFKISPSPQPLVKGETCQMSLRFEQFFLLFLHFHIV